MAVDLDMKCGDCGATFIWTQGEQKFYAESGFSAPKRCKPCRILKKERRAAREAGGAIDRGDVPQRDRKRRRRDRGNREDF